MAKPKNFYIKYKLAELENYIQNPESCVKKLTVVEPVEFAPNMISNFKESIMNVLSRKIGKYDIKLDGVVLDFRNTKILQNHCGIRADSRYSVIHVETSFYVFSPRKDAVVEGEVKHINLRGKFETIISVVIYRVFNVKVIFKKQFNTHDVKEKQIIKLRIKKFHFDNEIPNIEGEMIGSNSRKLFEDTNDSGVSDGSIAVDQLEMSPQYVAKSPESRTSASKNKEITTRESSQESDELPRAPPAKRNKRKLDESLSGEPITKRIKTERLSDREDNPNDDDNSFDLGRVQVKREKPDKLSDINQSTTIDTEPSSSTKSKKKKKDKKQRKNKSVEDDFETTLQLLLNTSNIKQEK